MKVAILYDTKFGNTKKLAELLAEGVGSGDHQVKLFGTNESAPQDLLAFDAEAVLVGAPTHAWSPARTLGRYLKKLGKLIKTGTPSAAKKAAAFNCMNATDVCHKIQKKIDSAFPNIQVSDKTLALNTGGMQGGNWEDNWEEKVKTYISDFLTFIANN
jgi:flavorubredoxin